MKKYRKMAIAVLSLVFLFSLSMAVMTQLDYSGANRAYAEAAQIAGPTDTVRYAPILPDAPEAVLLSTMSPETTPAEEPYEPRLWDSYAQTLFDLDLAALREKNPDVIGWILIPDTNISYPLVQGTDNTFYLEHTWEGRASFAGSIFLEAQNTSDMGDHNTILYGHNLKNGTMFTLLHKYKRQSFWENHRHVYIITSDGVRRYEIFAAYEAPVDGPTYWLDVDTAELKQQLLDEAAALSVLDTGITPDADDKILTLSTCTGYTYARRWVVKARLEGLVIQDQEQPDVKHLLTLAE